MNHRGISNENQHAWCGSRHDGAGRRDTCARRTRQRADLAGQQRDPGDEAGPARQQRRGALYRERNHAERRTVVREYVAQNGAVFAVVWHGPQMAPLNTLLGSYFPEYLQGISAARAAQGGGHGPAMVQADGLIVQTGGHMGNFTGRAYLPQALPQGISPDDLQ
jgi:hypothetical protein